MINKMIIKNFENHENTEIDFCDGFNLVYGDSNAGKTSIVRALQLVVYNDWDPKSLRIGTTNADITVFTERGSVRVLRGATNEWFINKNGEEEKHFVKPGTKIIPEAAEVIGLNVVKLGSKSIRPNIMNQLEAHFMLAEIEGDSISGSTRAQIIDEISGLAGMEELIRVVGLDNSRNSKEIKQNENIVNTLKTKKHDFNLLLKEKEVLSNVEEKINQSDVLYNKKTDIDNFIKVINCVNESLNKDRIELSKIPDCDKINNLLKEALKLQKSVVDFNNFLNNYNCIKKDISNMKSKIDNYFDVDLLKNLIDKSYDKITIVKESNELINNYYEVSHYTTSLVKKRDIINDSLEKTKNDLDNSIKSVELCPICLKPVHYGCDAFVRKPIVDKECAKQFLGELK